MTGSNVILKMRLWRLLAALATIAVGITLRLTGYEVGLPYGLVKYGGSMLWGAMVFLLVAAALPRRLRLATGLACAISLAVELLRLYHAPWLDAFRLTLAGALLLGRIFSLWNILAYLIGIALAGFLDHRLRHRHRH
ncbi:DUF2809 domain-containing protein [Rhizobium wuzhouense]|uniref:DUF2809 domain-containing protein n=1 Tax=Rhizobium wuzhouense TaxID=1986026 RepID=A0ABX5NMX2_9HYPH|nr:DUF2809 domain-containing protein [Rhizobium wuzhouense]PYB71458.1 DUF2809 domain-containing protein [Rhizobium wuzhouense]